LVEGAVQKALTDGWRRTDHYGAPIESAKLTLQDVVREALRRGSSNWNTNAIDRVLATLVDEQCKAEMGELKVRIRAQLDAVVASKLRGTIESAFKEGT
jgi:hypothetical protein